MCIFVPIFEIKEPSICDISVLFQCHRQAIWKIAATLSIPYTLFLKIPYMGAAGDKLVKTLKRKIQSNLTRKINIRVIYTINKLSKFCGVKDKIPEEQQSNVIYSMQCPGCGEIYVGKTSCCFGKRMDEHGTRADQPLHQHLSNCNEFNFVDYIAFHIWKENPVRRWNPTFTKQWSRIPRSSHDLTTG